MEKKELYKKAREYLGKTVSYGIGNIKFDYDRPDGKEYIYEESQDDEDMENFAVMDFLEDLLVDFIKQELDRAREEGVKDGMRGMIDILCEKGCGSMFAVIEEKDVNKKIEELSKLTTK